MAKSVTQRGQRDLIWPTIWPTFPTDQFLSASRSFARLSRFSFQTKFWNRLTERILTSCWFPPTKSYFTGKTDRLLRKQPLNPLRRGLSVDAAYTRKDPFTKNEDDP